MHCLSLFSRLLELSRESGGEQARLSEQMTQLEKEKKAIESKLSKKFGSDSQTGVNLTVISALQLHCVSCRSRHHALNGRFTMFAIKDAAADAG